MQETEDQEINRKSTELYTKLSGVINSYLESENNTHVGFNVLIQAVSDTMLTLFLSASDGLTDEDFHNRVDCIVHYVNETAHHMRGVLLAEKILLSHTEKSNEKTSTLIDRAARFVNDSMYHQKYILEARKALVELPNKKKE